MLSVNNLSVQYGDKHLFKDVSAQVHPDDRIGLIGVNGTGKSTLLKIMCGIQEMDPGIVNRASWFTVAYLPQEVTISIWQRGIRCQDSNFCQLRAMITP